MSEAEQSRKPQRGAGFAGEDADSAAGAGAGSAGGGEGSAAGAADPKTAEADASPEVKDAAPEVKDAVPEDKSEDGDVTAGAAGQDAPGAVGADDEDVAAGGAPAGTEDAQKPGLDSRSAGVTTAQDDPRKDAQGDARGVASADTKPAVAAEDAKPAAEDAKPLPVMKAGRHPAEPADAPAAQGAATGASSGAPADGGRGGGSQAAAAKSAPADRTGRAGGAGAPLSKGRGATGSEGRLLAGRYRLGGVLGRGGMGTVWRAVDETLGRTVAVKELRFPNSIDDDEKRRLITRTLREAKAIARIRNNSAVTVYDVVDEDDRPWIVMELVEGKSLAEVVREDGVLTPRRAAEVGLAILDVLRSAHREGILHRDVKPSNVLIGRDGRVVLTDFGIAQVEGDPSITSTGMLVGAPSYISPERARGHKPGPAADLWSLGGLLYASVEGCPPYDKGSAIATLTAVMTEPLDPPKNAGPLEEVIYGLLAKDPAQRLDDAGARALLTQVVNAPEAPVLPPEPEPSPEATRAIRLPSVPPVPPAAPKDPAADRVRGALRSVRNAAAAVKTESKPQPAPGGSARPAAPVRAPLTDVVPRRTLVIIAAVALLAVLSTVLVFAFGDDDTGNQGKGKDETAASAGSTAGGGEDKATGGAGSDASPDSGDDTGKDDGKEEDGGQGGSTGSPDAPPSGDPKGDDSAGGDTLPAGYVMVSNDRWHFTMAMPSNFRLTGVAGQNSGGKFSVDGGVPRVQVDFNNSPKDDAAAAWAAAVAGVSATSNGYKHLGIGKVEYNGYPTVADWQFERNEKGQRVRILNRGFKVDARRGYSIMITCKASEWRSKECETLRKTAFATFSPKD
ncbi:serine/threonine-protein kinase [Streptomyces sp. OZ13]|uniref:serine/threonine-protein kinase n=1 Tax=Streptomyces sp. OZ13 TaxID=3452210 RepID=UPI003F8BA307